MNKKQEDKILVQAAQIEKSRMWKRAEKNNYPVSDGVHGKQYCLNCCTIWNYEGVIKEEEKFLEECLMCGQENRLKK